MQCGDLERYLEAFLDGRLGRSRTATLRRHLSLCAGCRARVERLRQFERDMQRRFRSMRQDESIWRGLELDLVAASRGGGHLLALPRLLPAAGSHAGSSRQPPGQRGRHPLQNARAGGRSRGSRLAGLVLIAMAVGAVYQLARDQFAAPAARETASHVYRDLLRPDRSLALQSRNSQQLEHWLSSELGMPVALPITPEGYQPVGADRAPLDGAMAGAVIYRSEETEEQAPPVVLLVEPVDEALTGTVEHDPEVGPSDLSWSRAPLHFTVIGDRSVEELRRFMN